jgi:hypothetical protein
MAKTLLFHQELYALLLRSVDIQPAEESKSVVYNMGIHPLRRLSFS